VCKVAMFSYVGHHHIEYIHHSVILHGKIETSQQKVTSVTNMGKLKNLSQLKTAVST
jgi:hypothetical protein